MEDAILKGKPERPSRVREDIPRELERICLKAMERLIADRFDSMHEFAAAVEEYQGARARRRDCARSSRPSMRGRPGTRPSWPALHRNGASSRRVSS